MALVITLILLAVITFMAVAFLVISRAGKGSVTTTTDQTIARLAADAAFERAQAELLAPVMCSTNPYNYGLLVSTNYINSIGFIPGLSHPTNVNYDYTAARAPLTPAQYLQNLTNLLFNPRPPVFVPSRRFSGVTDFRFYVDLNRNGRFDANGFQPVINPVGGFYDTNGNWMATIMPGNTASNFFVGDPEWIGGLEFPTRNHAADNKFVYRYAYMVVPVGNTLDINFIHNQAANPTKADFDLNSPGSYFFRNQGVGTWEINLAAFLYDLNTNTYAWGGRYDYVPDTFGARVINGNAFIDAFSILTNRYAGKRTTLTNFAALYPVGVRPFNSDFVDGYTAGPLMITNFAITDPLAKDDPDNPGSVTRTIRPWPGANNINRFFTTQELFDTNKTSFFFANRL
ncbi:MAG TPA: hypothetical protein VNT26_05680, partial [Candidatus Sulfotelmatobacter sp.]|nr:hypothetical protein [Candidatus Sulfotelmatobacter sp.]